MLVKEGRLRLSVIGKWPHARNVVFLAVILKGGRGRILRIFLVGWMIKHCPLEPMDIFGL